MNTNDNDFLTLQHATTRPSHKKRVAELLDKKAMYFDSTKSQKKCSETLGQKKTMLSVLTQSKKE